MHIEFMFETVLFNRKVLLICTTLNDNFLFLNEEKRSEILYQTWNSKGNVILVFSH